MRIKMPTTKAVPTITESNEDAKTAEAWANGPPAASAKKRSQPKRKTPPKLLRSYRLPQRLLDRIGLVSNDINLPEYTVVELLLNEALAARGVPKTLDKPG